MKELPDSNAVAAEIYGIAHNAMHRISVTNDELRHASGREKLREGFRVGVVKRLSALGCEVSVGEGVVTVEIPDKERVLSLTEARKISNEAKESGFRSTGATMDNDVI
jgi:hypothetical protein